MLSSGFMDYQIPCGCGQVLTVTEGSAGSQATCACGRQVAVPSLGGLRQLAGLPAPRPSPELVIEQLLLAGALPPHHNCVHCGMATANTLTIRVECERVWRRKSNSSLAGMIGLFLSACLGPIAVWVGGKSEVHEFGRDKIYALPLPICADCRPMVSNDLAVWVSLERVPEYRRLLEKFPEAKVDVVAG